MIGTVVASKYKILERVGRGGMGDVYKAEDLRLQRFVAVKFLSPDRVGKGVARDRFVREARAASVLDHPNICTIFEISELEDEDRLYIVMAYYGGRTLWDRMGKGKIPLLEGIDIATAVLDGLAHAHAFDVFHRDVKPANIMLTDSGQVKLLDFGLAKRRGQDRLTRDGMIVGTPAYMAPEQVLGRAVDARADLWAVGVVLYEMVTARLPYDEADDMAIIRAIAKGSPAPLSGLPTTEISVLAPLMTKALAHDPENRYAAAAEMKADLLGLRRQLTGDSAETPSVASGEAASPVGPSIAVLPFEDLSPDQDQEYFCTGMAEELTTALGSLGGIHIASRLSAARLKDLGLDVKSLGTRLEVSTVLEGSVRKAGNRLRIAAQLTEAATGFQLWSESFDRQLDDVFTIQEEIAETIVATLRGTLAPDEQTALGKRPTASPKAFTKYLRGRHLWNRRTTDSLRRGIDYFRSAIGEDPHYAKAYAGVADSLVILAIYGSVPPREVMPEARTAAIKALSLDDQLAEAHTSLACICAVYDWDWRLAEASFRKAIELDPRYATARQWLAMHCLLPRRRFDEAEAELRKALESDPLSPAVAVSLGILERYRRRLGAAIEYFEGALELDPSFSIAHRFLAICLAEKGLNLDAQTSIQRAAELAPESVDTEAMRAIIHAHGGNRAEANEILQRLLATRGERYVSAALVASVYTALGEKDRAVRELHQAHADRASDLIWIAVKPALDPLFGDERFEGLVQQIGLV